MVNRLMALLDEILTWTETALPLWQRDAARRLVQNQSGLSDDDYTELYALLKAANGLPNPLAVCCHNLSHRSTCRRHFSLAAWCH